jgi:pimeloyl-ACP methyl ester carboxylesterase
MALLQRKPGAATPEKAHHLVVLIHGLWGTSAHLAYLSNSLRDRFAGDIHLLASQSNPGNLTYDGIDTWAERVEVEIDQALDALRGDGHSITKFSIVGYSLGGVVARYVIGLLYHKGFFDQIQPVNFVTIATPHLGARTPVSGFPNQLWNVLSARLLSASGRQLFLIDRFRETSRPLLSVLADPDSIFLHALRRFRHRSLYANIINDRLVPVYTASLSPTDPYADLTKVKLNYIDGSVILDPEHPYDLLPKEKLPTFYQQLRSGARTWAIRTPLIIVLVALLPVALSAFLVNSGVQTIRSQRRLKLREQTTQSDDSGISKISWIVGKVRVGLEDAFESINAAQPQDHLPTNVGAADTKDTEPLLATRELSHDKKSRESCEDAPTLALTASQFAMIEALDDVGFKKWPVHIQKVRHSHAAIIVRSQRSSFEEGKVVIKHFLDNFVL